MNWEAAATLPPFLMRTRPEKYGRHSPFPRDLTRLAPLLVLVYLRLNDCRAKYHLMMDFGAKYRLLMDPVQT